LRGPLTPRKLGHPNPSDMTPEVGVRTVTHLLGLVLLACAPGRVQRSVVPPSQAATLDRQSPYLKAHLRTGYVYLLSAWQVDSAGTLVSGRGSLLTPDRELEREGEFRLPVDSVALFETNLLQRGGSLNALAVMTGITAVVTAACISEPKACFGSCPTFYVADGGGTFLQAEGFSASIAPGLEATDLDALYRARATGRDFRLHLRNEALETHIIRHADLLALPRPPGGRVFATTEARFRTAAGAQPPARCVAAEGDCSGAVAAFDGRERTSRADSFDLAARETIDLEFEGGPPGELGLVIGSRQSLMTTYLLYQWLSYLGRDAARWLGMLTAEMPELGGLLGRIEVLAPDSVGGWTLVGHTGETGPLAPETKVVTLPAGDGRPVRLRLQLTRGLWRIDYLALVRLGGTVLPVRIPPSAVERSGRKDHSAWRDLVDTTRSLVTLPGDAYDLVYRLPPNPERYELFLESRGYYLEWMRQEWLADENPMLAARMVLDPAGSMRALAPAFKRKEPELEKLFWKSRYVRR
jgi:hypothetical protein